MNLIQRGWHRLERVLIPRLDEKSQIVDAIRQLPGLETVDIRGWQWAPVEYLDDLHEYLRQLTESASSADQPSVSPLSALSRIALVPWYRSLGFWLAGMGGHVRPATGAVHIVLVPNRAAFRQILRHELGHVLTSDAAFLRDYSRHSWTWVTAGEISPRQVVLVLGESVLAFFFGIQLTYGTAQALLGPGPASFGLAAASLLIGSGLSLITGGLVARLVRLVAGMEIALLNTRSPLKVVSAYSLVSPAEEAAEDVAAWWRSPQAFDRKPQLQEKAQKLQELFQGRQVAEPEAFSRRVSFRFLLAASLLAHAGLGFFLLVPGAPPWWPRLMQFTLMAVIATWLFTPPSVFNRGLPRWAHAAPEWLKQAFRQTLASAIGVVYKMPRLAGPMVMAAVLFLTPNLPSMTRLVWPFAGQHLVTQDRSIVAGPFYFFREPVISSDIIGMYRGVHTGRPDLFRYPSTGSWLHFYHHRKDIDADPDSFPPYTPDYRPLPGVGQRYYGGGGRYFDPLHLLQTDSSVADPRIEAVLTPHWWRFLQQGSGYQAWKVWVDQFSSERVAISASALFEVAVWATKAGYPLDPAHGARGPGYQWPEQIWASVRVPSGTPLNGTTNASSHFSEGVPFTPSKRSASRGYPSTALRVNAPIVKIHLWAHLDRHVAAAQLAVLETIIRGLPIELLAPMQVTLESPVEEYPAVPEQEVEPETPVKRQPEIPLWPRVQLHQELVPNQHTVDQARQELLEFLKTLRQHLGLVEAPAKSSEAGFRDMAEGFQAAREALAQLPEGAQIRAMGGRQLSKESAAQAVAAGRLVFLEGQWLLLGEGGSDAEPPASAGGGGAGPAGATEVLDQTIRPKDRAHEAP